MGLQRPDINNYTEWSHNNWEYAFYGCSGLTSIAIPSSVTTIGSYAFYNCSGLTSMTIPNTVTTLRVYVRAVAA
ncbi:leucine-rich repeat domain-containing protein [Duncaniella muris]|uniref:leucine-rich repeat domain-containing protein n=1 Tax=Duncaniella muris TaxID=2094150 RepID=UPI003F665A7B